MSEQPQIAVILAAGQGDRLMPLTADRPKPMVLVGGKPILERTLSGLRAAGIDEVVIVHGYLGKVIEDYFTDGASLGLRLHYRAQAAFSGTADALRVTADLLDGKACLLQWGDILIDPANYPAVLQRYRQFATPPSCLLGINWVEDPYAGGAVYRQEDRITRLAEKLPAGTAGTHWNIAGLMIYSPRIWPYLAQTPRPAKGEFYLTYVMQYMLEHGETILPFEILGERMHLTYPRDIEAAAYDPRLAAWEASLFTSSHQSS